MNLFSLYFLKILYIILIIFIIYDVFNNFLKIFLEKYLEIRNFENKLKNKKYVKYIFYSRFYPVLHALKQWRVSYPIVLFCLPMVFNHLLGNQEVINVNNFIIDNILFFTIPFLILIYIQNKLSQE